MAHVAWGHSRLGYNSYVVKVVSGKCLIGQIARGKLQWGELNGGRCPVPNENTQNIPAHNHYMSCPSKPTNLDLTWIIIMQHWACACACACRRLTGRGCVVRADSAQREAIVGRAGADVSSIANLLPTHTLPVCGGKTPPANMCVNACAIDDTLYVLWSISA